MDFTLAALSLAGAIALLLWGTHMVQTGVQRAFGPQLRVFLSRTLGSRVSAFLAGIGVTALLQSSTATCLMATNFAAEGLVAMVPAMAIMLGANVGTALIVVLLSFDVSVLSAPLLVGGVILFRREGHPLLHDLGRVAVGLGLMLLALHEMLAILAPFAASVELRTLLALVAGAPLLVLLIGAIAAWVAHSSVAVVLLVMSLATHGVIDLEPALLLVLGANLGTAINPLLEATGRGSPTARRLPLANQLNRLVGIALSFPVLAFLSKILPSHGLTGGAAVAVFHLGFNTLMALATLPVLDWIARGLDRLIPDRTAAIDPGEPIYLDHGARETPMVALAGAAREALRLADTLEAMLYGAREAIVTNGRRVAAETKGRDDVLDSLNRAVTSYVTSLDPDGLGDMDRRRRDQILAFSMNMEQAGDVIDRVLLPHAAKRIKRAFVLGPGRDSELSIMIDRVVANVRTASALFMTDDAALARSLAAEKVVFRNAEQSAAAAHFEQLRAAGAEASQASALHLDLLRDMKLINSHIVAAAAYPVLDRVGELLESRTAAVSSGLADGPRLEQK